MKIIVLAILLTFYTSNIDCNKKFEIVKATSKEWKGGTQESGYGTYYELTIVPKVNSGILRFDKLWIGETYFQVSCFQKGKRVKNDTFGAGDTITIMLNDETVPKSETFDINNIEDSVLPKEYSGEALLSYVYSGKRKYSTIKKFTRIEPIYYP